MFKISESFIIERPPIEVFPIAADPDNQLKWDSENLKKVEKLTAGPLGRGARYRGSFKGMGVVEYDYSEYEPGRRFAHHSVVGMGDMLHLLEFEAVPEGTRLTQSMIVQTKGLWTLMTPFMKTMMRNRMRLVASEIKAYLVK
ncbi:MAG: SRPBCC family protein [Chloroflexi bacterium]|nr:SRPBCC family protein [Chloroflexota bacterium]